MQIKGLHKNIYRLSAYSLSQQKCEEHRKKYELSVQKWRKLKAAGHADAFCQTIVGISRATYYRHETILKQLDKGIPPPTRRPNKVRKPLWTPEQIQSVLQLRRENLTYGKAKIAVILQRDNNINLSESSVGRILKNLMSRGLVQTSASAPKSRKKRRFSKGHAQPWNYRMKAVTPGNMVQIDHMTVSKNGLTMKHFQAWDPVSKYVYANVYSNAKSATAKKFLLDLIENTPFSILSIQVDGGSEFMKDFELTCQNYNIPLFVLPPNRPQYNGGVERANRTFREEFYNKKNLLADSITAFRADLTLALSKYNTFRPHSSLRGATPLHYIHSSFPALLQSHMY